MLLGTIFYLKHGPKVPKNPKHVGEKMEKREGVSRRVTEMRMKKILGSSVLSNQHKTSDLKGWLIPY